MSYVPGPSGRFSVQTVVVSVDEHPVDVGVSPTVSSNTGPPPLCRVTTTVMLCVAGET